MHFSLLRHTRTVHFRIFPSLPRSNSFLFLVRINEAKAWLKYSRTSRKFSANPSHSVNLADKLNMFKINPYVAPHGNIVPVDGQGGRKKRICHPPCTITPRVKGNFSLNFIRLLRVVINIIPLIFLSP